MTPFDDMLESDMQACFLNTAENAERIMYYPAGGDPREITAVVDRSSQQQLRETHHNTKVRTVAVFVDNDATDGISNPQQGDAIRLAEDPTADRWDFVEELHADAHARTLRFTRHTLLQAGQIRPDQM